MTYSIVARDPDSGHIGAAVASHAFAAGGMVPWAQAGVGAVVTQSFTRMDYGPRGLALMSEGVEPTAALSRLLGEDPGVAVRQVALIDVRGRTAAHTGEGCVPFAGHLAGPDVHVQANMMLRDTVCPAMLSAFESCPGDLAERLFAALQAAEAQGGDVRGRQSAAIVVVRGEPGDDPWNQRVVDIRVDDALAPLDELRRLLDLNRAMTILTGVLDTGLLMAERIEPTSPELGSALAGVDEAQALMPGNFEPTFWQAVLLAKAGRHTEAAAKLRAAAEHHAGWTELAARLSATGLITAEGAVGLGLSSEAHRR